MTDIREQVREQAAKVAEEVTRSIGAGKFGLIGAVGVGRNIMAAIRSMPLPDAADGWQDMSTAPKDGTLILGIEIAGAYATMRDAYLASKPKAD